MCFYASSQSEQTRLRPVIYLKKDGITEVNKASITTKANDENDKEAFVLVGRFDNNGALSVDDLAYEKANHSNELSYFQVLKLYGFDLSSSEQFNKCKFDKKAHV